MNATSFPDATKDEYREDRLHKAAEIVWLWVCGETGRETDDLVPDQWFEQTMRLLQRALDFGETNFYDPDTIPFWVYWRALEIMNIPKIEASSSQTRERTERFGAADIDGYADEQRRASVGGH